MVKDGYIVKEAYRLGHTESSVRSAASVTKSLCSLMYGMAVEQGWANVEDLVRERNSGNTRQCAADADFRHVLTMTGRSIDPPLFQYDASGTACLDTVADFFAQNNPQGLDPNEWKDRFFREALGDQKTPLFIQRRSFCQDRLGTNIGKSQKQRCFSQAGRTPIGRASSAAAHPSKPPAATSPAPRSCCLTTVSGRGRGSSSTATTPSRAAA